MCKGSEARQVRYMQRMSSNTAFVLRLEAATPLHLHSSQPKNKNPPSHLIGACTVLSIQSITELTPWDQCSYR